MSSKIRQLELGTAPASRFLRSPTADARWPDEISRILLTMVRVPTINVVNFTPDNF